MIVGSILTGEASRDAVAQSVTVKLTGCGFDPRSIRWNIYLNLFFHFFALVSRLSAALSSATQHAMPPEFGRKWGTECLMTLGSLCLPCCVRDTAWRMLVFIINGYTYVYHKWIRCIFFLPFSIGRNEELSSIRCGRCLKVKSVT